MTVRSVVVFPAPLRPTRQTTSRACTSRETRLRIWLSWMKTSISWTASMVVAAPPDDHVDHAGVGLDGGGRGIGQHLALAEGDDPVRVAEDDVHVVLDLDDGAKPDPLRRLHQDVHDHVLVRCADAARGLVEQDDLRAQGEGRGHVEQLLVSLGQLAGESMRLVAETEERGDFQGVGVDLPVGAERGEKAGAAAEPRDDGGLEGLEHGELREDLDELEAPRHAEAREGDGADPGDVSALEAHGAPARWQHARQHVDERGLARAVGTDDGDELTLADRQAHAVQRHVGAVELADVVRFENHAREVSTGRRRAKSPMRPDGAKMTMKASMAPKTRRQ